MKPTSDCLMKIYNKGYTLSSLSKATGISLKTIYKLKKGESLSVKTAIKITEKLNYDINELFILKDDFTKK